MKKTGRRLIHLFEELNRIGTTVIMATYNTKLVDAFKYSEVSIVEGRLVNVSEGLRHVG